MATNKTVWDLYRQLPGDGNVFFSPVSIRMALSLAALGARGETRRQMCDLLDLEDDDQKIATEIIRVMQTIKSSEITVEMGNKLFAEKSFPFNPNFRTKMDKFAGFEPVDFSNSADGVRQHINTWVEEQTHDRITNLLPQGSVDGNTILIIVNAIYFLGNWMYQFNKEYTTEADFNTSWGAKLKVQMMYQSGNYMPYGEIKSGQVLQVPYTDANFSMLIAVANEDTSLAYLEAEVTKNGGIDYLFKALNKFPKVNLFMPRLEMTKEYSLKDILQKMGMVDAFVDRVANFSGMTPIKGHVYVTDVFHKAFVKVDEKGTEAAASTGATMSFESVVETVTVHLDRAFIFAIVKDRDVLFIGRVENPTK
jgi:serpin B